MRRQHEGGQEQAKDEILAPDFVGHQRIGGEAGRDERAGNAAGGDDD